jgi:hypothetical protein
MALSLTKKHVVFDACASPFSLPAFHVSFCKALEERE